MHSAQWAWSMVWLPWPTKMHYLDIVSLNSKHIETSFSHIQQICCAYNSLRCVNLQIRRFVSTTMTTTMPMMTQMITFTPSACVWGNYVHKQVYNLHNSNIGTANSLYMLLLYLGLAQACSELQFVNFVDSCMFTYYVIISLCQIHNIYIPLLVLIVIAINTIIIKSVGRDGLDTPIILLLCVILYHKVPEKFIQDTNLKQ